MLRLLLEAHNAAGAVDLDHAKMFGLRGLDQDGGQMVTSAPESLCCRSIRS